MKVRCLIVDDEPLALDVLENYIERLDTLELVARCKNAIEAYNKIQTEKIDLLFLDIQMPKLTGIDFMKSVKNPPKVIFTTAYREYAIEGYELDAVDYLLKPISFDRFLKAVNKVIYNKPDETKPKSELNSLITHNASNSTATDIPQEPFIYLKSDKKMVKVLLKDILYIESLKDYIRVKTPGKEVVAYQKISYLEEKLPEQRFMRIHRSFIINLEKIEAFCATHAEVAGFEIPIGRNYKNEALKKLNEHNLLDS
ncbi:LytR/AlgR family response regulator transcription factor [Chondrinema litorale]|uniref:LytR/AlgR family response regulator transcription factor n=1 Tax=Chondrinema litorale TaxID=2994555 RepID=UPI002543A280|nr:response regulator transcription factor [Chondrinema litorale]UZR92465.1 response regulator transcription factor [Chondrinema litorale]